jgi:hypothetical protein
MNRLKIACRRSWIAKHTEGMCGVGKWLVIWQERETEDCPRCSEFEDARHDVWLCPDAEATLIRKEGILGISRWMEEVVQMDPEIRTQQSRYACPSSRTTYPCFPFKQTRWACRMPYNPKMLLAGITSSRDALQRLGASTRRPPTTNGATAAIHMVMDHSTYSEAMEWRTGKGFVGAP